LKLLLVGLTLLISFGTTAGGIFNELPKTIDKNSAYVFYSHGFIVEGDDPQPKHKQFGIYDFPAVKEKLADDSYHLIATHRPAKTDPFTYSKQLAEQVQSLIERGVPAKNISLVGFSRGGFITALTSSLLANKEVNFVILAACTSGLSKRQEVIVYGHLLSIYETSDSVGSCDKVVARNPEAIASYKEIAISTGKDHGAFYQPIAPWLKPVRTWLKRDKTQL